MSKKIKVIGSIMVLFVTLLLGIGSIVISTYANKFVSTIIVDGYYYVADWNVAVIICVSFLLVFSIISCLFNTLKINGINNKSYLAMLIISIIIAVVCLTVFVVNLSVEYSLLGELVDLSGEAYEYRGGGIVASIMNNATFNNALFVLTLAAFSNIVSPIIPLITEKNSENNSGVENDSISGSINSDIKNEILKLKQQLELEDLKKEYASLYKKLHNGEEVDKVDEV